MNTYLRIFLPLWLVVLFQGALRGQIPAVLDQFQGIHYNQFTGTANLPPDISGGVGKQGILQVVNVAAAFYPKTGGVSRDPFWSIPLVGAGSAFPTGTHCFDPRAAYDRAADRYFIVVLDIDNVAQKSYLHLAVSKNEHPRGMVDPSDASRRVFDPTEWHRYRYDMTRTTGEFSSSSPGGADYPTLGLDGRSVYVTVNYFGIAEAGQNKKFDSGLEEAGIFVFDRAALLSGAGAAADGSAPPANAPRTFFPSATDGSIQPAMPSFPYVSPSNAFFLGLDQDAVDTWIDSFYIGYPGGNGFTTDDDQTAINDLLIPDPAPQPGSAPTLDTLADRMQTAVRDNNDMVGVFVSEADNSDRSVIRVVRMRPQIGQTDVRWQAVLDAGNGFWNALPTIAINDAGCLCVTWTASSSGTNPSIYYATTGPSGDAFSAPRLLLMSATPYYGLGRAGQNFARWGDYAHASVDPVDGAFWICQEYAYSGDLNSWGSYWAKISPRTPPVIVKEAHMTTPQNPNPQFGSLLPNGENGAPIRTLKACAGQQLTLACQVQDGFGQNFSVSGAVLRWYKDDVVIESFINQSSIPFTNLILAHQGRYRFTVTDSCGYIKFSEEIFLDVVIPPEATLNQERLILGPNASGYFEVTPNPATVAEMDALSFTWNRPATYSILNGRVQAFRLYDAEQAAEHAGVHTCTVSNMCGSITLSGNLVAGPQLSLQPNGASGAPVCGQPVVLTVAGLGSGGSGAPGVARPDFGASYNGFLWTNDHRNGWSQVQWRKDGVPIVPGGRISTPGLSFETTRSLQIANPDYEDEGIYDCVVTDAWGAARAVVSAPTRLLLHPLVPPFLTTDVHTGPENRLGGNMVFDTRRGRMVLFGGEAYGINPRLSSTVPGRYLSNDTWEWDGQVWVKRNPAIRPPALTEFSMVYDSERGRVIIFGGYEFNGPNFSFGAGYQLSNKVWEWDGNTWAQIISTTPSPSARINAAMVYDEERKEALMIGGNAFSPNPAPADYYTTLNALWAWDGVKWMQRTSLPYPAAQASSAPNGPNAMAFDRHRKVTVMFGPFFDSTNPVWEYNGTAWSSVQPPLPLRLFDSRYSKAFYDPIRRLVGIPLFAGNFAHPTGADNGKSFLAYWDGNQFIRGEILTLNDINGALPAYGQGAPFSATGDLFAYDTTRRCLVWLDTLDQFYNSGPTYKTRELHFSGKIKVVRQPVQASFASNGALTLSVIAAGLRPMSFQWYKDGVPLPNSPNVSGADTATLTLSAASAADAGRYTLRMSNAHHTQDSAAILVGPAASGLSTYLAGENLVLSWSGNGLLETAVTLTGPWQALPAATSPYTVPTDAAHRFFRLRY